MLIDVLEEFMDRNVNLADSWEPTVGRDSLLDGSGDSRLGGLDGCDRVGEGWNGGSGADPVGRGGG